MSDSQLLVEDMADLTMSEASQDFAHTFHKLTMRSQSGSDGLAASKFDVSRQAADFQLGLSLAMQDTSTAGKEAKAEEAKTAAYTAALDRIHNAKAKKVAKKRKNSTQRRPETSYKKARLRKADGSATESRYRPTVHEKLQVLRYRYGDALTSGHTVRETLQKFANVTHAQLKKWKKQSV